MDMNILVIDDEENIRKLIANNIESWGYSSSVAGSVEEALQQMQQKEFQAVITDKNMPSPDKGSTGGMYILKFIRKMYPATEVIMITGFSSVESAIDAMKAGAFDYIVKPFKSDELKEKVDRILEYKELINPVNTIPIFKRFQTMALEILNAKEQKSWEEQKKIIKSMERKIDFFFQRQKKAEYFTIIQHEALSRIAGYAEQLLEYDHGEEENELVKKIIEEAAKRI